MMLMSSMMKVYVDEKLWLNNSNWLDEFTLEWKVFFFFEQWVEGC